jgi:hypothetical protein
MRLIDAIIPLAITALCGCSTVLADSARADLEAQCAEQGMQFVETERELNENIVMSSAAVSGFCVGPGDPRYVTPDGAGPAANPGI